MIALLFMCRCGLWIRGLLLFRPLFSLNSLGIFDDRAPLSGVTDVYFDIDECHLAGLLRLCHERSDLLAGQSL